MNVNSELLLQQVQELLPRIPLGTPHDSVMGWARAFIGAHTRYPGGTSIEVGSYLGGSAFLFAMLLEQLYPEGPPMLWTVDPYGGKPYVGQAAGADAEPPIYGDAEYAAAKQNLAAVPFHTHWMLTSTDFFTQLADAFFWRPGTNVMKVQEGDTGAVRERHVGEPQRMARSAAFILLDGEHRASSILADFQSARRWLRFNGTICIDNVDVDPATLPQLRRAAELARCHFQLAPNGVWAEIRPL